MATRRSRPTPDRARVTPPAPSTPLPLTARQQAVLRLVVECVQRDGFPPTQRELAGYLEVASTKCVREHLERLVKKGYLRHVGRTARGLQLTQAAREAAVGGCDAP